MIIKIITLILLFVFIPSNYSQFYVPDPSVDSIVKKKIKKEYQKFARCNLTKKERKEEINILTIYWMTYDKDSLRNDIILTKVLLEKKLKFGYKISQNKVKKTFQYHCHGIVYNNKNEIIGEFNQTGIIYKPSRYGRFLLKAITEHNIKYVFQITNLLTRGLPSFLVDEKGEIFVYEDKYLDKKIIYNNKILSLNDFKPTCCFDVDTYLKGEYEKD